MKFRVVFKSGSEAEVEAGAMYVSGGAVCFAGSYDGSDTPHTLVTLDAIIMVDEIKAAEEVVNG